MRRTHPIGATVWCVIVTQSQLCSAGLGENGTDVYIKKNGLCIIWIGAVGDSVIKIGLPAVQNTHPIREIVWREAMSHSQLCYAGHQRRTDHVSSGLERWVILSSSPLVAGSEKGPMYGKKSSASRSRKVGLPWGSPKKSSMFTSTYASGRS